METTQRGTPDTRDISEAESENKEGEECLFKVVARIRDREKLDIPMYEENLDIEELLYWFIALDKYFDYEDIKEDNKVKHTVTRLNIHVTIG